MSFRVFLLMCCCFFVASSIAAEPSASIDPVAREIFSETMSPYCPGRLLSDCPSGAAHDLKQKIREKLTQGETKDGVLNYLYSVYGEEVRAAPKNEGFGRAAWIATPIFLFVGFAFILIYLRSTKQVPVTEGAKTVDPLIKKRIEQEVSKV